LIAGVTQLKNKDCKLFGKGLSLNQSAPIGAGHTFTGEPQTTLGAIHMSIVFQVMADCLSASVHLAPMAEKGEKEKMQILHPGGNEQLDSSAGFIMLRGLLAMFTVIICLSAALIAMAVLSRQGFRFLENTQREIIQQNEIMLRRAASE
jgi:hypothetical protein